jgi:hypothetical protein
MMDAWVRFAASDPIRRHTELRPIRGADSEDRITSAACRAWGTTPARLSYFDRAIQWLVDLIVATETSDDN